MKKQYAKHIIDIIETNSKVLDLGCGNGELLDVLRKEKKATVYGVEIDFDYALSCIKRGISVFQGDIDEGLAEFSSKSYDYVILSQTLQQVKKPQFVISEMLRIGKKAIITFPNFAYWQVRFQLFFKGVSPVTKAIPYEWHNTPNIRVITIKNFKELCEKENISITYETPLFKNLLLRKLIPQKLSNLLLKQGVFIITNQANQGCCKTPDTKKN
jgi:methionine biosynthesis protein MetW